MRRSINDEKEGNGRERVTEAKMEGSTYQAMGDSILLTGQRSRRMAVGSKAW